MKESRRKIYKRTLILLQFLLPKALYNLFYKFTFRIYKTLIRLFFLRFLIYFKIKGDKENFKKVKAIYQVMPYSLVGAAGLSQTYDLVIEIFKKNIKGDLIECGVAQGGCAVLMTLTAFKNNRDGRKVWLFDSFEGLPEPTDKDFLNGTKTAGDFIRPLNKGSCLGEYEKVKKIFFSKFKINKEKVRIIKGWFQETLPQYKDKIDYISLLRIDADWYESTKICLESFYGKVTDGGFIVIDDYETCFGAKRALDEFLEKRKLSVKLIYDGRGGCCFKKPFNYA